MSEWHSEPYTPLSVSEKRTLSGCEPWWGEEVMRGQGNDTQAGGDILGWEGRCEWES